MMDLLEEMAATVTEHDNALDQAYDEAGDPRPGDLTTSSATSTPMRTRMTRRTPRTTAPCSEVTCPNCGQILHAGRGDPDGPQGRSGLPALRRDLSTSSFEGTEDDSEETDKQDQ